MNIKNKIYTDANQIQRSDGVRDADNLKMKVLTSMIMVAIGFVSVNALAAPVSWVPDADGNWEDGVNWSSDPALPQAVDDVTIDVGTRTRVISINSNQSINSLSSQEDLVINSGTFTLANGGSLNGALTMGVNSRLTVNGGLFGVTGAANIDGANVTADGGSAIGLSTVSSYTTDTGSNNSRTLQALNASTLNLSGITTMAGGGFIRTLFINSRGGSSVNLSSLMTITGGATSFISDGVGSTVDLSMLTDFQDTNGNRKSILQASSGGAIDASSLLTSNGMHVTVSGASSSVNIDNITDLTNGTVRLEMGGNVSLNNLTNGTGSSFVSRGGTTLDITSMTTYDLNGGGNDSRVFEAVGLGSKLDASGLTTAAAGGFIRTWFVNAENGGEVDLSNLNAITSGAAKFVAKDANSLIDLSSLTLFNDDNGNRASVLEAKNGGEVRLSSNAMDNISLSGVDVILHDDGSILNTDRITSFEKATFTTNGVNRSLNVSNADGASFIATNAVLDVNNVIGPVVNQQGTSGNITYRAAGAGARVNLTGITSITNESAVGPTIDIQANSGGTVNLQNVTSIVATPRIINASGPISIVADGAGSHVDLSSLTEFKDLSSRTDSKLTASNGATVQLNQTGTTVLTNINVSTDEISSITGDTVELVSAFTNTSGNPFDDDITTLGGSGTYGFNVINTSGVITPGNAGIGSLIIDGDYTEGAAARIDININDLLSFDSMGITGNAFFAGDLNVILDGGFDLLLGMSFDIIDITGIRSSEFFDLTQGDIVLSDNGFDLFIDYTGGDGNDIVLTTIMPSAVPVPAAVWLFGSGLIGLVGVARRKT